MTGGSIDVAFTPADVRATQVTVVVDVLRASSTIVAALAVGYARVLCAGDVEQARRLRGPGRELAGERECRKIEGFDHGNSPREFEGTRTGDLVLCTTNGTPAILAAVAASDYVLVGSLNNLDALVAAVPPGANTTIVCAGTNGRFALEDAYTAGRIVGRLEGTLSDAAQASLRLVPPAHGAHRAGGRRGAPCDRPGGRHRALCTGIGACHGAACDDGKRRRGGGLRSGPGRRGRRARGGANQ